MKDLKLISLLGFFGCLYLLSCKSSHSENVLSLTANESIEVPPTKFGFRLDSFNLKEYKIQRDQFLSNILGDAGISSQLIHRIAEKSKDVFDVRKLRYSKPYTLVYADTCKTPAYFVYQPDVKSYVTFELKDSLDIYITEKPVYTEVEFFEGTLDSAHTSLWSAMEPTGVRDALIAKMEEALGWTVDFYYVHPSDEFKAIYEKEFVEGTPIGVGKLVGAYFKTLGVEYYAVLYENEKYAGYYDLEGRPMIRKFLKSPVQYSRISSRYNPSRFHPVLKRRRAHRGTDYAALHGTPIRAVADGTVTKASYTKGNGNYVKLRHDKVYQTQYLHMSKFGPGIQPGVRVRQGQTIGYVGSTGLATGPHVCFRFWKNGKQIDHLRLNLPPPKPMDESELPAFRIKRDSIMSLFEQYGTVLDTTLLSLRDIENDERSM